MNNFKKIILDNGVPLYLNTDDNLKQIFFGYLINYGSSGNWFDFNLNGKDYHVLPGMAHFLEHLLGERSKNGNIYTNNVKNNNEANAYTSQSNTFYYVFGKNNMYKSIKELIEAIDDPVFTKEDVDKTRCAIEEEATMTLDEYNNIATNLAINNLYKNFDSFYKTYTSIGNRSTTKKIDFDTLRVCYDAFYQNQNKKLVITGNVNEKEIVDFLNNTFSKMPKHESSVIFPNYDKDPIRKDYDELNRNVTSDINAIGIKVKKPHDLSKLDLIICLEMIAQYLFGNQSKYSIYIKDNRLIDVLKSCMMTWNDDYLEFVHSYITNKNDEYYKVLMDFLTKKEISKEEFEMIKKTIIADEVRSLDYKYDAAEHFEVRSEYTESISDIDYLTSINYDRFKEIFNEIDFSNNTKSSIKKLIKK